jgi:hypothetical protein
VSVNRAVVAKVGVDHYGVYLTDSGVKVLRDGVEFQPTTAATAASPIQAQADGSLQITWPDGSRLSIRPIGSWGLIASMELAAARRGKVSGLLGDYDGNAANDLVVRGGAPVGDPTFAALYPKFADSWRIAQADSMFDYAPGQSTATFTDRSYPAQPSDAHPAGSPAAEAVCRAAGVTDPISLQNCILDVALSGQAVFAAAAATAQPVANTPATGGGTILTVKPGGTASMTFQGTAGQKVFVDLPSSTLPDECSVVNVRGPDGKTLNSGCVINGKGLIDRTELPVTGAYTVVIDPAGDHSGVSTVRVDPITDDLGTAVVGTPTTLTAAGLGALAERTFQGTAGQKVFVDAMSSTLPDQCGVLSLRAPDGSVLEGGCVINGAGFIDGVVLPAAGTYTIRMDPAERGVGAVQLKITTAVDQHLTTTVGGGPVTATIAQPGAVSRLSFTGSAGQRVTVDASAATIPDQCGVLSLLQPDGNVLTGGCVINGAGSIAAVTLPAPGTYTVLVDPAERGTGTVRLSVGSR